MADSKSQPGKRNLPSGIHRDGQTHGNLTKRVKGNDENAPRGQFHDMFERFRDDLDEHYDRKERIVKASRDVTAHSKKIIFALQRVKQPNRPFPSHVQKDVTSRLSDISTLLASITPDLQSLNRYRYAWSLRGLEELVEALSFAHYLQTQTLITPEQAQAAIPVAQKEPQSQHDESKDDGPRGELLGVIPLTWQDYMYGCFDLFGEMMRFATVTTAQTGQLVGGRQDQSVDGPAAAEEGDRQSRNRNIMQDIQELGCAFEMLPDVPGKEYRFKMEAMRQSVKKVEKLGYGLVVRGSERPRGWLPDMKDDAPEPVSPV